MNIVKSTSLTIGNVHFEINSQYPIHILSAVENTHGEFRDVDLFELTGDIIKVNVSVVHDNGLGLSERGDLLGETISWKIYQSGDGRELVWGERFISAMS